MTIQEILAAHHAKQEQILAALRKGVAGHPDTLPLNVQCGDLCTLIELLDEARAKRAAAPAEQVEKTEYPE